MMSRHAPPDGPHYIDRLVGKRIRQRRIEAGISQEGLGRAVGVSFQQIQKYENASNRVTASIIYEIARVLCVTPEYFFPPGLRRSELSSPEPMVMDETLELALLLARLGQTERRTILDLIRGLGRAKDIGRIATD